jgi:hypothetical protein
VSRSPATAPAPAGKASSENGRTFLSLAQVVERYAGVWSSSTLYKWTRSGQIPHRKLPGRNELLFSVADLEAWEDGAELETVKRPKGGRICRPAR